MKTLYPKRSQFYELWFVAVVLLLGAGVVEAQWPPGPPITSPNQQRNALNAVRSQIGVFQNATRNAPYYAQNGYGNLFEQFQGLRQAYNGLKQTLNPGQQNAGANAFAELDAGLDILEQAFANYQNDLSAGRDARVALRDTCQVLREASTVWAQQLKKTCYELRVGVG
jgi:hypothetical protein